MSGRQSPPKDLTLTTDRKRIGWHLLITTLVMVTLSAGFAIVLLLWVTVIKGVPSPGETSIFTSIGKTGVFLVNEGTTTDEAGAVQARLRVLTFSSVATQIVSATASVLVLMTAYCTAGAWLDAQNPQLPAVKEQKNLPTPAQFGLLIKLSSTGGLMAIYDTIWYLLVRHRHRQAIPPLFRTAFITIVGIYFITHLASAADLWLHVTSTAVLWNTTALNSAPDLIANSSAFGIKFNDTICGNSNPSCLVSSSIATPWGYSASTLSVLAAGYLTAANASFAGLYSRAVPNPGRPLSVITLSDSDDLAIIVPTLGAVSSNNSLTWNATTYGMRASCRNITPACMKTDPTVSFSCSDAGYPNFPSQMFGTNPNTSSVEVAFGPNSSTSYDGYGGDNPYTIQLALSWQTTFGLSAQTPNYGQSSSSTATSPSASSTAVGTSPQTGQTSNGPNDGYGDIYGDPFSLIPLSSQAQGFGLQLDSIPNNITSFVVNTTSNGPYAALAECQIEYFNLTVTYDYDGTFKVGPGQMVNTSREFSTVMAGPLLTGTINTRLQTNLAARVLAGDNGDTLVAALNQELARLPLAMFSGSVVTEPLQAHAVLWSFLVARYEVLPVLVYAAVLFLYSIVVLVIFVWASAIKSVVVEASGGEKIPSLELAQRNLTDPLALVGLMMPDALHDLKKGPAFAKPIDMFKEVAGEGDPPRLEFDIVRSEDRELFGVCHCPST